MKSLNYPGGGNPRVFKTGLFRAPPEIVLMLMTTFCLLLSSQVFGIIHIETFDLVMPVVDTFDNGVFHHEIEGVGGGTGSWNIEHSGQISPGVNNIALALYPAQDTITFNLGPGEYVEYVSVDFIDLGGGSNVTITDSDGLFIQSTLPVQNLTKYSINTAGSSLGRITSIVLSSYEGMFDNVAIHVVPEPATMLLVGLGGMMLRRRKA